MMNCKISFGALTMLIVHVKYSYSRNCITNGGPSPYVPCIFPFKFSSVTEGIKTHYNCIVDQNDDERRNWCSTKVDDLGFHKSGEGNWGYCKSNCKGITNLKTKNGIYFEWYVRP